jgi:hypothetical protein
MGCGYVSCQGPKEAYEKVSLRLDIFDHTIYTVSH